MKKKSAKDAALGHVEVRFRDRVLDKRVVLSSEEQRVRNALLEAYRANHDVPMSIAGANLVLRVVGFEKYDDPYEGRHVFVAEVRMQPSTGQKGGG